MRRKYRYLFVRMSETEHQRICEAAKRKSLPVATWARGVILKQAHPYIELQQITNTERSLLRTIPKNGEYETVAMAIRQTAICLRGGVERYFEKKPALDSCCLECGATWATHRMFRLESGVPGESS